MLEFDQYDKMKYELFEQLLPTLLYDDRDNVGDYLLQMLEDNSDEAVYDLFCKLCEDDKVDCPYKASDFAINRYEEGGVRFIELSLPESSDQITHVVRAYVLIAHGRKNPDEKFVRYFIIKKFRKTGQIYILYVSADDELQLGSELTDHADDREYERRALGRDYLLVVAKELYGGEEQKEEEVDQA